jgi:hypothetical protein
VSAPEKPTVTSRNFFVAVRAAVARMVEWAAGVRRQASVEGAGEEEEEEYQPQDVQPLPRPRPRERRRETPAGSPVEKPTQVQRCTSCES